MTPQISDLVPNLTQKPTGSHTQRHTCKYPQSDTYKKVNCINLTGNQTTRVNLTQSQTCSHTQRDGETIIECERPSVIHGDESTLDLLFSIRQPRTVHFWEDVFRCRPLCDWVCVSVDVSFHLCVRVCLCLCSCESMLSALFVKFWLWICLLTVSVFCGRINYSKMTLE